MFRLEPVIDRLGALPAWFAKTLIWDRGTELARDQRITATTGIAVYFADPRSPWQRGSNEDTNGLLREHLPEGTDLSTTTPRPAPGHRRRAGRRGGLQRDSVGLDGP